MDSAKATPSPARARRSWFRSKGSWRWGILMLLLAGFCLWAPTAAIAQKRANPANPVENCVAFVPKSPSVAKWDRPLNNVLSGDALDIKLSWTPSQPSDPMGAPSPVPGAKAEAPPVQTVRLCAKWSDAMGRVTRDALPLSRLLRLEQSSLTDQEAQFLLHLDAAFPPGIRRPIEIQIKSSQPERIPSFTETIHVSQRWLCGLLSSAFVGVIYLFLARAVHLFYSHPERQGPDRAKYHGWRILDPAVISASDYGAASLANLQILWFTLIVSWILAYGWLVMGRLLTPSPELLGLLGISGAANVLAKSLSSGKQRLSLDTWNWLVQRQFLKREVDIDPVTVAKWGDFVVDRGVLDPSRYQLIVFGFLIGFNLLCGDIMNVETFNVPQFFLLLQTLSSSLYLFGKSVSPNSKDELEQHLSTLMKQPTLSPEDKDYLQRTIESLYGERAVGPELLTAKP